MEVNAGFFAIKQYRDKSLEPLISWAICEKDAEPAVHKLPQNENNLKHKPDYWAPYIIADSLLTDSATYDIKHFKTQAESIHFIKQVLIDSLQRSSFFQPSDYTGKTIEIIVLSNGTLGNISVNEIENDSQLTTCLKKWLLNLPEKWFPALAYPLDVSEIDFILNPSEEEKDLKMRVNSKVIIEIK